MGVIISLVGLQSMAVVSPLITLINRRIITKPEYVYLLHTKKTCDVAQKIQTYLQNLHSDLTLYLKEISNSLQDPKAPQIVFKEILERHKKEKVYFNLAGAMNYQISACVLSIEPESLVYVYPESEGIRLFEIDKAGKINLKIYKPFIERNFETYFRLQGIDIKTVGKVDTEKANKVLKRLADRGIVDKDSIVFSKAVVINNVSFNYVFNSQNELIFVRILSEGSKRDLIRKIINLATNRHDFGELMHHKIVVITSSPIHKERLQSEAGGKVIVIDPNETTLKNSLNIAQNMTKYETERLSTNNETDTDKSLYLALGREIMPTINALWSHKPKRACIIYTPHDETVQRYKKAIIDNKERLPCSEIVFIPTDITGKEILDYKPEPNETIECNITPGTKAQCVILSIFANMHGGTVWSINQGGKGSIDEIPEGKSKELRTPDIFLVLTFKGFIVKEYKTYSDAIDKGNKLLLRFLDTIKDTPHFKKFPKGGFDYRYTTKKYSLVYNGWKYEIKEINNTTPTKAILCYGNKCIDINLHNDAWFEELTAWALKEAGATNIMLNYKRQTNALPNQGIFSISEIDIIATFLKKIFIISCKTSNQEKISEAISELKGTVSILGRFAIPLLSFFRHKGEPKIIDGVYVFGIDTLCDKEKMRKLLNDAIKTRRTTAEEV